MLHVEMSFKFIEILLKICGGVLTSCRYCIICIYDSEVYKVNVLVSINIHELSSVSRQLD